MLQQSSGAIRASVVLIGVAWGAGAQAAAPPVCQRMMEAVLEAAHQINRQTAYVAAGSPSPDVAVHAMQNQFAVDRQMSAVGEYKASS